MPTPYLAQGRDPATWVLEAIPRPLRTVLEQRGGIPHAVRLTAHQQLDVRSPEQLRERIERRWYERFSHLPGAELAERADGIALELVAAAGCEVSVMCEDGWLLDQDAVCSWCRPSGTVFDIRADNVPDGRRLPPDVVAARAAKVRAAMRSSRRYREEPDDWRRGADPSRAGAAVVRPFGCGVQSARGQAADEDDRVYEQAMRLRPWGRAGDPVDSKA
jgi:hypothetical protein